MKASVTAVALFASVALAQEGLPACAVSTRVSLSDNLTRMERVLTFYSPRVSPTCWQRLASWAAPTARMLPVSAQTPISEMASQTAPLSHAHQELISLASKLMRINTAVSFPYTISYR